MTSATLDVPKNKVRGTIRALRPLFWWALLVLVMYGHRTHVRLLEHTRLVFRIEPDWRGLAEIPEAALDDRPFSSGDRVSLGSHCLRITHPKAETWSTNLFMTYGKRDLRTITLRRGKAPL